MPIVGRIGAVATVATLAFCVWLLGGWGSADFRIAFEDNVFVVLSLFATGCAGYSAWRSSRRWRISLSFITIGLAGWTVGSVLWAYYEWWLRESPFPSPADIAYLLFPLCVCIGLIVAPVGASGYTFTRLVLDGFILTAALFQIGWLTVLGGLFDADGASHFALGLSLVYPIIDFLALTVAMLLLGRVGSPYRVALTMLTTGLALMTVADSIFAYMNSHNDHRLTAYSSVAWAVGLLLMALAFLSPVARRRTVTVQPVSPVAMWLPYLPIVVAIGISLVRFGGTPGMPPALFASVLLIVLVLLRQFIVVAENRRLMAAVAAQAMSDPLTGLANRALFQDRLDHALALHQRNNTQSVAVLSLDLDDFKLVNDGLGHPAGDQLLVQAAARIRGRARSSDTVARIGGDEFVVLMEGDELAAREVAHQVLRAFDDPFVVDGHDLLLRPSAGLAVVSADDPETPPEVLLKQADMAMYAAKRSRMRGVHIFSAADMADADASERASLTSARAYDSTVAYKLLGQLRRAIDNQELTLAYQPKFALADGAIVGVEALVRWPHPDRGVLAPDQFLQLVRDHGLMRPITELVFAEALDQVAAWRDLGLSVPVAVNVFAPSLSDPALPETVSNALKQRGLPHGLLTIEITEDLLLGNVEGARQVIQRLRQSGVRVAIDDFGSGYSALSYLRDLNVHELKLDRAFLTTVLVDKRAAAILRAVIDLANELGLITVAEGVEDPETAALLKDYGCQVAQGYLYSPPLTPSAMLSLLRSSRPAPDAAISS